jgi:S-adenosylmethionine/arginine decarboxylase-like enzyme
MGNITPDNRHKHLIVRAEVANPPLEGDLDAVCAWMSKLISDIGMKELAPPRARYCPVPGNRGMTADAIIETSHVALHSWDECVPAVLQFDLYTCSDLTPADVIAALDFFGPSRVEYKFLDREYNLTLVGGSSLLSRMVASVTRVGAFIKRLLKR